MLTQEYWEGVFETEDPWGYGQSQYEEWKFDRTLSVLGDERSERALEIACAEGHLTARLAPQVGTLLALDISPTAVKRARERCHALSNVDFKVLNLISAPLPGDQDLIVCSEVLFYLPLETMKEVALRIANALKPGGRLVLAHGNLITDDKSRTGFDWGHPFGAKTIGQAFAALGTLYLERELHTPLFAVQLFRREVKPGDPRPEPDVVEEPIPFEIELNPEVERTIIWGGARTTRAEVTETEKAAEIPILMYHSISDTGPPELRPYRVSPRAFREQLRYLRREGYSSITLTEWAEALEKRTPLPGRPVLITFDDGYEDFSKNAWPELQRSDFSATMFVVTDKVGGVADWDAHSGPPLKLMSWETLSALRDGGIVIASHSASHKDLSVLSSEEVQREGAQAREALRRHLNLDVDAIAFPWGRSSPVAVEALRQCGYRIAVTTWGGSTFRDDLMMLPRIEILGDDGIGTFAMRLRGQEPGAQMQPRPPAPAKESGLQRPVKPEERAATLGRRMPLNPAYAKVLSSRMEALVAEFVKLQTQLLRELDAPMSLQRRLAAIFCQAVTGSTSRRMVSGKEISPGVKLCFDEGNEVDLTVDCKRDHSFSPESYLNTINLGFSNASGWSWLEIDLEWGELAAAERFQFNIFASPSRSVEIQGGLLLPKQMAEPQQLIFATLELTPEDHTAVASGELSVPDLIQFDTTSRPKLMLFFHTNPDLAITIHYLNVYFA